MNPHSRVNWTLIYYWRVFYLSLCAYLLPFLTSSHVRCPYSRYGLSVSILISSSRCPSMYLVSCVWTLVKTGAVDTAFAEFPGSAREFARGMISHGTDKSVPQQLFGLCCLQDTALSVLLYDGLTTLGCSSNAVATT